MTDLSDQPSQPAEPPAVGWSPMPPAPPVPPTQGTNGLAIASLILAFVFFPFGLLLGIIALVQINKSGEKGRGLAIAGVVISCLALVAAAAAVVAAILGGAERDESGAVTEAGSVGTDELRTGDCLIQTPAEGSVGDVRVVPCAEQHEGEVFAVFTLPEGDWPGDEVLFAAADEGCGSRIETNIPQRADNESLEVMYFHPTSVTWRLGDREIVCVAVDPAGRTGSIRG